MTMRFPSRTIAISAVLLFLSLPVVVEAQWSSSLVGSTATITGSAGNDVLTIVQEGGLFRHFRFSAGDPGFNSNFDFDTSVAGDQTLSSSTGTININAGDGNDFIGFDNGVTVRGAIDGGPGNDEIGYITYTTPVFVNLGLGTTGLAATLGADQENPPTTHAATGTATVSNYNIATHTFDINVNVTDLPPNDVIGFHIHQAPVGVNGPIIIDFTGVAPLVPSGTGFTFTATGLALPAASEAAFLGGGTYVNVHTGAFTGGAIRGQLFTNGNVNLASGTATGAASIQNIENATGGAGNDSLVGNFGINTIHADAGNDWIVGGPGNDTLTGGPGSDVLVWSNGDGTDVDEGGADSDTVQVNGNTANTDQFTVSANGTRVNFVRAPPGPFSLDIGTVETLTVNGVGGGDTFTVNDLTGVASLATLNLNGFAGDDVFAFNPISSGAVAVNVRGGADTNILQGPNGAATWNVTAPGAGNIAGLVTFSFIDVLIGGSGDDTFNVKAFADGTLQVIGGGGTDTLNYNAEGRGVTGDTTPPDGTIDSPGVQTVTFSQVETATIINPPTSVSDAYATNFNTPLTVAAPGVLANDNTNGGGAMTAALVSGVSNGTLLFNADGSFSYTPSPTFAGSDSFTYRATNTIGAGNLASVIITVVAPTSVQPPSGFRVSSIVGNVVTFRWTPPAIGPAPTGYVLEGGISVGQVLASLPTGSASPIATVGVPTGAFYARVHALDGAARSAASNEILFFVNMPVPPSAPAGLVGVVNDYSVELAWRNTFGGGATEALILDVSGSLSASVPLGSGETANFNIVPAGNYTFSLRAANAAGISGPSDAIALSVPSACTGAPLPPDNFLAYKIGNTAYVVWEPAATGNASTGYVLHVDGAFTLTLPTNQRTLSGTVPPGVYNLSVSATNVCGSSAPTPVQTLVIP